MAYFEPDGTLYLISGLNNCDQIRYYADNDAQLLQYFMDRAVATYDDMSYMQHDGVLTVELDPSVAKNISHVVFYNPTQEQKYWYGAVTGYKWINSAPTCDIYYEIDYWLTFMHSISYNTCEIARECPSEVNWAKAMSDPYDSSIIEMCTPEPISVSPEEYMFPSSSGADTRGGNVTIWPGGNAPEIGDTSLVLKMATGWLDDLSDDERTKWDDTLRGTWKSVGDGYSIPSRVGKFPSFIGYFVWKNVDSLDISPLIDLITLWGLTSEIIGIYVVPEIFMSAINGDVDVTVKTIQKPTGFAHPKLARFPFSYIKIVTPDGVAKEYKYELFSTTECGFACTASLSGVPIMYISPMSYMYSNTLSSKNIGERVEYADFPQAGYNTDAYLSFLNSQYNSATMANNATAQTQRDLMEAPWYASGEAIGMSGGTITGAIKGWGQALLSGANPADSMIAPLLASIQKQEDYNVAEEAERYRTMSPNEIKESSSLSYASPAYVADKYIPGGNTGYIPYETYGKPVFLLMTMTLNTDMQERVTKYLNRYGCRSGRIGIPYIAMGAAHWSNIDGNLTTYCQTSRCEITAPCLPARRYIESMFNAGVLFIRI